MRRVAILGSTGSIGRSAVEVIAASADSLQAVALVAHRDVAGLAEQARLLRPKWVVIADREAGQTTGPGTFPPEVDVLVGPEHIPRVVSAPEVDVVLSAIVGRAGLEGTWAALSAGKIVALANKETLVLGGPLVTDLAHRTGATIIPVDSEHSAVFQILQSGGKKHLRKVILTASGGPFRNHSPEQLASVTVEEALSHPTWRMGKKITIDSATLMNKALEIIEARWLFDLQPEQIGVLIHPQSVVHALVEFVDGSVLAQLSQPDMRLPIQLALTWPERQPSIARKLDWSTAIRLEFEPPDWERFPALQLGLEVARVGGTAGAVLNAANEVAVEAFLKGRLPFSRIVPLCRRALEAHPFEAAPTLERLLELDRWTREEVTRWIGLGA
ncbi:MAG: 1-deoxy-D-xylulose-5-phosphate reductoisomerase [Thermoguttaceae bacterium]|nr:1-deoxy-D-xylulose-5-phosphate reductoisomerase [Thermoguttaceae bacterium]MDW8078997.1 1-deoxy-D-xylulose-5-phosphate reductoisomerase [Thermoguttaceae bacterium]